MDLDPLLLSRVQFAFVVSFHIIFPAFTIGLAAWLATIEGMLLAARPDQAELVSSRDATREYAYGPAGKLSDTKVGTFTQALYNEALELSWVAISMENDWKRIFAFEQ